MRDQILNSDVNMNEKYFWNRVKNYIAHFDEERLQKFLIKFD